MAKKIWNAFMKKYMQAFGFYNVVVGGVLDATGQVLEVEAIQEVGTLNQCIGNLMIAGSFEYDE